MLWLILWSSCGQASDQGLYVHTNKEQYRIGQPISFSVQVNTPGYLYVFSMDAEGSLRTVIQQPLRLSTGQWHQFPDQEFRYELYSDREGVETLYFVHSPKVLASGAIESIEIDTFYPSPLEALIKSAESLQPAPKAIRLRNSVLIEQNIEIREVQVRVHG